MLFYASKIFWRLLGPSHLLLWFGLLAPSFLLAGRRRAGTALALATAAMLIGIGIVPSYQWLGRGLEAPYDDTALPSRIDGILVLGGGGEDNRRLPTAYMVARRYPHAKFVFSGGDGSLLNSRPNEEAQASRDYLLALGLDPKRLILEGRSRNTVENLRFSKDLVKPQNGEVWLLVTAAYHLPRAMEAANQVGWQMVPWPSFHYTSRSGPSGWFEVAHNIEAFDAIAHERLGLLAYRIQKRLQK